MSRFSKALLKFPIFRFIFSGNVSKMSFVFAAFLFLLLSFSVKTDAGNNVVSNYLFVQDEGSFSLYLTQNSGFYLRAPYESFENTVASFAPPLTVTPSLMASMNGAFSDDKGSTIVEDYIVQEGDTLSSISEKFGISVETIKNTNKIGSTIYPGQKLIILPVDGLVHEVKSGDTVWSLAKLYKAKVEDIIAFNDLPGDGRIYIGDTLIIPYGKKPEVKFISPSKVVKVADGYFICPIGKPCRITNPLHWYNAVDLSHGKCGDPVFAAAGGKVLKAKTTQSRSRYAFGGLGNHVRILHPNGATTTYAHLQSVMVFEGQNVSQGQVIGLMGGKPGTPGAGKSTGCHLHFSVGGAANPFAK